MPANELHPDPTRPLAGLALATLIACGAGCASSSGGGEDVMQDPPIPIGGEYDVHVSVTVDDCDGIGGKPLDTPMQVEEIAASLAEVDLPVGGAGGECNRIEYARNVNTLERLETVLIDIGPCPVRLEVTTVLDFFDDDSVSGSEINEFTPLNPIACLGEFSACTIELAIVGDRCATCFDCSPIAGSIATDAVPGVFAGAVRRID